MHRGSLLVIIILFLSLLGAWLTYQTYQQHVFSTKQALCEVVPSLSLPENSSAKSLERSVAPGDHHQEESSGRGALTLATPPSQAPSEEVAQEASQGAGGTLKVEAFFPAPLEKKIFVGMQGKVTTSHIALPFNEEEASFFEEKTPLSLTVKAVEMRRGSSIPSLLFLGGKYVMPSDILWVELEAPLAPAAFGSIQQKDRCRWSRCEVTIDASIPPQAN